MKELSRFEMAAVKRTAQNVKTMRRKLEKLEVQQAEITKEVNSLSELIYDWEQPIINSCTITEVLFYHQSISSTMDK